jgi:hypothetical protein
MPATLSSATTPTFGGLADGVTKGQAKVFSVVELRKVGGASGRTSLQPTGVSFAWSADDHAIPRGPWVFGVKQRTVREDYPGSENPSEQILGWNYEPFTLTGVWDDRYGGENFALNTWLGFEALTKRGNPVRLSFERVTITGVITSVQFSYKRADLIEYQFTVSPHFRTPDETVLDLSPDRKDRLMTDPRETVQLARRGLADVQAAQALATAENLSQVQGALSTTAYQDAQLAIEQANAWITSAENVVEGQLFVPNEAANAFGRIAQLMANTRDTSDALARATPGPGLHLDRPDHRGGGPGLRNLAARRVRVVPRARPQVRVRAARGRGPGGPVHDPPPPWAPGRVPLRDQ